MIRCFAGLRVALMAGALFFGIAVNAGAAEWPRQITDSKGTHTLERAPTRIVSTSVTLTGSLLAIDAPVIASGATSPGNRVADSQGFFRQWSDDDAQQAVAKVARALEASTELTLDEVDIARSAAFIITASEGGNRYLPLLRSQPERFEPLSRERLLAGAMLPAAWYVQAQRFRRHFQQQAMALFAHVDILIAPATPCSATLIGQKTMTINGQTLPVRASMGMLTQPISFLGLPVVTVPLRTASGLPIGVQLIAAPFQEARCLRAARALEEMGVAAAPVAKGSVADAV